MIDHTNCENIVLECIFLEGWKVVTFEVFQDFVQNMTEVRDMFTSYMCDLLFTIKVLETICIQGHS